MARHMSEEDREKTRARIAKLIESEELNNAQLKARGYPYWLVHEVRARLKHKSPHQGAELLTDSDMAEANPPYQARQFVRTNGDGKDD